MMTCPYGDDVVHPAHGLYRPYAGPGFAPPIGWCHGVYADELPDHASTRTGNPDPGSPTPPHQWTDAVLVQRFRADDAETWVTVLFIPADRGWVTGDVVTIEARRGETLP